MLEHVNIHNISSYFISVAEVTESMDALWNTYVDIGVLWLTNGVDVFVCCSWHGLLCCFWFIKAGVGSFQKVNKQW